VLVVDDRSGSRGCATVRMNEDHVSIVKPQTQRDAPAVMLRNVWKEFRGSRATETTATATNGLPMRTSAPGAKPERGRAAKDAAGGQAQPARVIAKQPDLPNPDEPRAVDKFDGFTMTVQKCDREGPHITCDFILRNAGETRNFRIHNGPTYVLDSERQQHKATVTAIGDSRNDASHWMAQTDVPARAEMTASASFGPISPKATSLQTISVSLQWSANGKGGTRSATFERIPIGQ
jgi:hypothetical protein